MPFSSRMGMYLSRPGNVALGQGAITWTLTTTAALSRSTTQRTVTNGKASTAMASFLWRSSSSKVALSATLATRNTWHSTPAKSLTKPLASTLVLWKPSIPSEWLHGTFAVMLHQFGSAKSVGISSSTVAGLLPHAGAGNTIASKFATSKMASTIVNPTILPQWLLKAYTNLAATSQSVFLTKSLSAQTRQWDGRKDNTLASILTASLQVCAAAIHYIVHAAGGSPFTSLLGSAKSRLANEVMGQNVSPTSWALSTMATFQVGVAQLAQSVRGSLFGSLAKISPNPSGTINQGAAAKLHTSTITAHNAILSTAAAALRRWLVTATASVEGTVTASASASAQRMSARISRVALPGTTAKLTSFISASSKQATKAMTATLRDFSPIILPMVRLSTTARMCRSQAGKAFASVLAGSFARTAAGKTFARRQISILLEASMRHAETMLSIAIAVATPAMLWFTGTLQRAAAKMARAKLGSSDGFPTAETGGIANLGTIAKLITFRSITLRQAQTGTSAQTASGQASTVSPGFGRFANAVLSLFRAALSTVRRAQPSVRKFVAPYQQRVWVIVDEAMIITTKDPAAIEDFELDWSIQLGGVDFINSSDWEVNPTGLTITQESSTDMTSIARLSGGAMNAVYDVANTVNLASGQVKVRHLMITIQEA